MARRGWRKGPWARGSRRLVRGGQATTRFLAAKPWRWRGAVLLGLGILFALLSQCAEPPPSRPADICAIFREKPKWYQSTRASAERWGVPIPVQMAILHRESSFRARARPPRRWFLWVIPGPRPSSAYGYAQAVDSTWKDFQESTGRSTARRDRFDDVAHFVGWYGAVLHRLTGIPKDDAYGLYLAYHEGPGGYARGSHRSKAWLLDVAQRVADRSVRYQRQLAACEDDLDGHFWRWVLLVLVLSLLGYGVLQYRRR